MGFIDKFLNSMNLGNDDDDYYDDEDDYFDDEDDFEDEKPRRGGLFGRKSSRYDDEDEDDYDDDLHRETAGAADASRRRSLHR